MWSGCPSCGGLFCPRCARTLNERCRHCGAGLERGRHYLEWLRPREDWRKLIPSAEAIEGWGERAPSAEIVASSTGENAAEIDRALPASIRDEFWEDVLQLEIARRLGVLDHLTWAGNGDGAVRLDALFASRVEYAASWHLRRADRAVVEQMREQERLAGLALLPPNAVVLDEFYAAAFDPRAAVRRAACAYIHGANPPPVRLPSAVLSALRGADPERRAHGVELLAALAGGHVPEPGEGIGGYVRVVASERLARAPAEEIERIVARTRDGEWFTIAMMRELRLEAEVVARISDELASSRLALGDACWWVMDLGPAARALAPELRPWATHKRHRKYVLSALVCSDPDLRAVEALWDDADDVSRLEAAPRVFQRLAMDPGAGQALAERATAWLRDQLDRPPSANSTDVLRVVLDLPDDLARSLVGSRNVADLLLSVWESGRWVDYRWWHASARARRALVSLLASERLRAMALEMALGRPGEVLVRELVQDGSLDAAPVTQALQTRLASRDGHPWHREGTVEALGLLARRPGSTAVQTLVELFCDAGEPGRTRVAAARALAALELSEGMKARIAGVGRDSRACVRAWSLLLSGARAADERVAAALDVMSPLVRFVAEHRAAR